MILSIKYQIPSTETITFLTTRPWFTKKHEQINQLLVDIAPHTHIVSNPFEHFNINWDKCELFDIAINTTKLVQGIPGHCHDNCEGLLKNKIIHEIYTGYALSSDGLWRYHSWGFGNQGVLIETTEPRLLYFGEKYTML